MLRTAAAMAKPGMQTGPCAPGWEKQALPHPSCCPSHWLINDPLQPQITSSTHTCTDMHTHTVPTAHPFTPQTCSPPTLTVTHSSTHLHRHTHPQTHGLTSIPIDTHERTPPCTHRHTHAQPANCPLHPQTPSHILSDKAHTSIHNIHTISSTPTPLVVTHMTTHLIHAPTWTHNVYTTVTYTLTHTNSQSHTLIYTQSPSH